MILLESTQPVTWVEFFIVVQGMCAIVALILSIRTALQGKQIRELADIAAEQQTQTKIFADMLRHTQFEYWQKTSPKFIVLGPYSKSPGDFEVKLINSSAVITNYSLMPPLPGVSLNLPLNTLINAEDKFNLVVSVGNHKDLRFDIFLNFHNDDMETFVQRGVLEIKNGKIEFALLAIRPMDMHTS